MFYNQSQRKPPDQLDEEKQNGGVNRLGGNGLDTPYQRLRKKTRRFFSHIAVELTVGTLVFISVVCTLFEIYLDSHGQLDTASIQNLIVINEIITYIFVIELSVRAWAATSLKSFFKEFWLDIIATLPHARFLRSARALKLLRLVRIIRFLGVASRLRKRYPHLFRKGYTEYLVVCTVVFYTLLIGSVSLVFFENSGAVDFPDPDGGKSAAVSGSGGASGENGGDPSGGNLNPGGVGPKGSAEPVGDLVEDRSPERRRKMSLDEAFWFSLYSMFAGEPTPGPPETIGGKIVAIIIMFLGLTVFAMFTGTVSALMIRKFRQEDENMSYEDFEDHIVICGWSSKAEIIISEYRSSKSNGSIPIIVITQLDTEQIAVDHSNLVNVFFIHDDFTKVTALQRAGVNHAATCIILSDTSGGRSEQDADARAILAALTVEKINPSIYSCAELFNRNYGTHLDLGHVNDYVVSGEYSAYMLAQAAMNRGVIGILGELLTYRRGSEFYRSRIPNEWVGRKYNDILLELKQQKNATLVAVQSDGEKMNVNPADHTFQGGDEVVVIGCGPVVED